jgi:hypothetical protein
MDQIEYSDPCAENLRTMFLRRSVSEDDRCSARALCGPSGARRRPLDAGELCNIEGQEAEISSGRGLASCWFLVLDGSIPQYHRMVFTGRAAFPSRKLEVE